MADLGILGQSLNGGTLNTLPPNASREDQIGALNDIITRLNGMLKAQVFSDGTTRRMIIGYQKDGWGSGKDFGIKISVDGVDVNTATDNQLLFKMDLATWFFYDPATQKNFMQFGTLPDKSGGFIIAKPGYNVADLFS